MDFAATSRPYARRVDSVSIQEREILRIVASLENGQLPKPMEVAINQVLIWAQKRNGVKFPEEAWQGNSFDCLSGGRTIHCVRLRSDEADLWAARCDDPDKDVPGRVWTTEVTIGSDPISSPKLSVRLLVSSREPKLHISPHVPGFLHKISNMMNLKNGSFFANAEIWTPTSLGDIEVFVAALESPDRLPIVVISGDERHTSNVSLQFDGKKLARAMLGLAHVVFLPSDFTYYLTDMIGRSRSVFHGAIRIYKPGFTIDSDQFEHPLFLGDRVLADPDAVLTEISIFLAADSVKRTRLERQVVSFGAVRSAALLVERESRFAEGASDAERFDQELRRADALDFQLKSAIEQVNQAMDLAQSEEERARSAEAQLHSMRVRIRSLELKLLSKNINPDSDLLYPDVWTGFADWCEEKFVGRLSLAPSARRGVRSPQFGDVSLVARCIHWLASQARDRFINGGGSIANFSIESGVENAPCGGDEFEFYFQGRKLSAAWHIKTGGNTRDPEKCLRIYYAFDDVSSQIVIADMPAHRHTDAS